LITASVGLESGVLAFEQAKARGALKVLVVDETGSKGEP
jgi:hypothetical protein